jgi:predicted DNA-binding transcriptional regulator AlpA
VHRAGRSHSVLPGLILCLTIGVTYTIMEAKKYSTLEVAELVKVSPNTMYRWMETKKFYVPPVILVGKVRIRLWTEKEVEAVRKYKANFYNKGRGHGEKVVKDTKRK